MEEIIEQKNDLIINDTIKSYLSSYTKWGSFFTILTYIFAAFVFVLSFLFLFVDIFNRGNKSYGIIMFITYFLISAFYLVIARYFQKSVENIKLGVNDCDQEITEKGFYFLHKLMSTAGIGSIILLVLSLIIGMLTPILFL